MVTEAEAMEFYLLSQRRELKRFLPDPVPPTGFGPLLPTDNLVERIEKIWNLPSRDPAHVQYLREESDAFGVDFREGDVAHGDDV